LSNFVSSAHLALGSRAPNAFVLDMLSPFQSLLRPKLTSRGSSNGSWRLLSSDDKKALRGVVDLMVSTGLTYKPCFQDTPKHRFARQQFGYVFGLEPRIDILTSFEFAEESDSKSRDLSNPMKKFLRHEIQSAIIRKRFEKQSKRRGDATGADAGRPAKTPGWQKYITDAKEKSASSSMGTPKKSKRGEKDEKPKEDRDDANRRHHAPVARPMNFLDRAKAAAMSQKRKRLRQRRGALSSKKTGDEAADRKKQRKTTTKPAVLFRFQEGFSNAVRRPVSIIDFVEAHGQWKVPGRSRLGQSP